MKRFEGRVAVVTGAASGIGRATAIRLADRGCALALADIDAEGLASVEKELAERPVQVSTHVVDVSSADAMLEFADNVDAIHEAAHILINNAGVVIAGSFEDQRLEDLEWMVGINYWGVVYGCHAFLPLLRGHDLFAVQYLSAG